MFCASISSLTAHQPQSQIIGTSGCELTVKVSLALTLFQLSFEYFSTASSEKVFRSGAMFKASCGATSAKPSSSSCVAAGVEAENAAGEISEDVAVGTGGAGFDK